VSTSKPVDHSPKNAFTPSPCGENGVSDACGATEGYLTIGTLAKLCGVTVRTLRYYEEMDLIGPIKRTTGKYRLYNRNSLKRVNAIQALQGLNFSLEEVLTVLGPYSRTRNYSKDEQITHTRQSLGQQKTFIDDKIAQLQALKTDIEQRLSLLDSVCEPCKGQTTEHQCQETCSYLEVHQ
jgi:DNA-binding transcriptional MerR regulator